MGIKLYLPHSSGCFICGEENSFGVGTKFYVQDDKVKADLFLSSKFCGFKGVVHGGIVAAVLDEAMGWAASVFGNGETLCFTRSMTVKYRKNVPSETALTLETEYVSSRRMIHDVKGHITDDEGTIYAEATGQFVAIPRDKMGETLQYIRMDDSLTYHPTFIKIDEDWKRGCFDE